MIQPIVVKIIWDEGQYIATCEKETDLDSYGLGDTEQEAYDDFKKDVATYKEFLSDGKNLSGQMERLKQRLDGNPDIILEGEEPEKIEEKKENQESVISPNNLVVNSGSALKYFLDAHQHRKNKKNSKTLGVCKWMWDMHHQEYDISCTSEHHPAAGYEGNFCPHCGKFIDEKQRK